MKFRSSYAVSLLLLLLATLSISATAAAQSLERGAVRGTVLDVSKSAIAGAKLTISNDGTGLKREYSSDENGAYTFDSLQPGTYTLVVEAPGFATYTVKQITVNIGASLGLDIPMQLKSNVQTVEVTAEAAGAVDTTTAGVSQLIDETSLKNLPLEGRDYRDLAQLTPSAQVVPGLRGGIRLGGQQSDYAGLVIDGADTTNNFFGENFGSLETKNLTVPLESVQEFQVVTNGFAPEFGRATGGLLNVVTKSGTNQLHGEAHEYYRGGGLTADDALHNPSNIARQNQFGGSVGFPIHKDRQFLFLSTDIQREHGPLQTVFCSPTAANFAACEASLQTAGPIINPPLPGSNELLPAACGGAAAIGMHLLPACYGVPNLAAFEGSNNQYQNFFTILGHYDYQFSPANHFSVRGIGTRNHTNGFTGGQGQTETFDAIGNTENFVNQGITGVFTLTTSINKWINEARVSINGETRKRHPIQSGVPEIQINGIGNFGQRFYLPSNNDNGKLQIQNNTSYAFARHDVKFGGDVDSFVDRKDVFAGWSAGEYVFNNICDFDPSSCPVGAANPPSFFFQGFGLNGKDVIKANTLKPNYQVGLGLYWQDKWQVTPRLTLTYGMRWDGTWNPQPQTFIAGATALVGQGNGTHAVPMPQNVPNDFVQFGPRVGVAYGLGASRTTVLRAAWGYYYAQSPTIFFPTSGSNNSTTLFCPPQFFCTPPQDTLIAPPPPPPIVPYVPPSLGGFPYLFPSSVPYGAAALCANQTGCPSPTYVDPSFKNPRISNLTAGIEHTFARTWTVSATYVFSHSENLRVGGFSTTIWNRNVVKIGTDQFGRSILAAGQFGVAPLDPTQFSNTSLASFGHGNYHSVVIALNKRFAQRYQVFANYTWSRNFSNASSERDTDTFFGPQDPYNLSLDYGRDGLDITHQFKMGASVDLPWGFTWSTNIIYHSGLPYPAYITKDINGDGTSNQGFGSNDRPSVQLGSGTPFLLPLYPSRQPYFFNWDMRIAKDLHFRERYVLRFSADLFNITNASNLYSNPDHSAFIDYALNPGDCTFYPGSVTQNCIPLTALPKIGQPSTVSGTNYRTLDQLAPGATAFAAQFGVRFQF